MCVRCDTKLPEKYTHTSIHIKRICGNCGAYIKFCKADEVPPFKESKEKIWEITNDLKIIEEEKQKMFEFNKKLIGIDLDIAYNVVCLCQVLLFAKLALNTLLNEGGIILQNVQYEDEKKIFNKSEGWALIIQFNNQ